MRIRRIIFTLLIIGFLFLIVNFILFPAYLSVKASCNPESFEENYGDNYYIAGTFSADETNTEIIIYDENLATLKHETCHLKQYEQNRLFSCSYPGLRFLNEAECYTVQRVYEILSIVR